MNSKLDLFRRRPIGEKIQSWDVTNTVSGCNWRDVFFRIPTGAGVVDLFVKAGKILDITL